MMSSAEIRAFMRLMRVNRPLKVTVSVEPPLLSDLLVRLLATEHREVSLDTGGADPDIAIVSQRHAERIKAPVVIRLPDDEANAGLGSVVRRGAPEPVLIASIEGLSWLLELHAPDGVGD